MSIFLHSWNNKIRRSSCRLVNKLIKRPQPIWVVYGNCNAQALAQFLQELTDVGERYEIVWGQSYNATGPIDLSRCKMIWAQHDEGNPLVYPTHIPAVLFPPCNSFMLWPFSTMDSLTSGEHSLFPYGDEIVISLSEDDTVTEENVYSRYLERIASMHGRIATAFEKDLSLLQMRDATCDVGISDFILENFQTMELQMTYNHPRLVTLLELFYRLCKASGLNVQIARSRAASWPITYQPFDSIQVPVMPQIAAHYGLTWWSADKRYILNGATVSAEEYLQKFLAFRREKLAAQGGDRA